MNIDTLEAMLAKGQDSTMLRFGLGKAYLDAKDVAAAAEHLQRCVEMDANYSAAWKLLGKALLGADKKAEARTAWLQGLAAAKEKGDKQTEREIAVFLKRLEK
ncbi:Tetratricopeptide repeat [Spongiibacter sp. IMCC21906]|uniref:tetratricopeptide repeat protein n=1 Tax=Spongiibacter sp. IMCC21906 TaxID=1620392 RepID=UPI00062E0BAC|nr:tetratricopeptide repeat protein [Spongiibacter sp. IMCC21906]AKH67951.1 Tetratricopeptide repeat [Spongiibacter sp. IMCC21906]